MHADPPSHSSDMLTLIDTLTYTLWNLDSGLFSQKQCHFFPLCPFLFLFNLHKHLLSLPCYCTALLFSLVSDLQVR